MVTPGYSLKAAYERKNRIQEQWLRQGIMFFPLLVIVLPFPNLGAW